MIQRIKKQFWLAVGLLTAMSAMFLMMPPASEMAEATNDWSVRIVGILFWAFAVSGYVTVARANSNRKKFLNKKFGRDIQTNYKPGILCFFSNKHAKIVDSLLAVFTALLVAALFTRLRSTYYIVVFLSLFIWAANMHCLFNGRIYRITKYVQRRKEGYE